MPTGANKMTGDFTDKPATRSCFEAIDAFVRSLWPCTREVKAQVSYAVRRKFLWMVVKSEGIAGSEWLHRLIRAGYEFAQA